MKVQPFLDSQAHGLIATRYPCRPNPIGISLVELVACRENVLETTGVNILDGAPLSDIKPYVREFALRSDTRNGWFVKSKK